MDETSLRFHSIKNRFVQLWYASRLWLIFAAGIIGTILSFSLSIHTQQGEVILSLNDVAPQDILAPYAFSDESEVLTEQARHRAATLVSPIYDPPDSNVSRQQINALQSALNFIDAVRADTHATHEQQLDDLAAIADIQINQETGEKLLNLADTRWQEIKLESISVLEQVMRREIRDTELKESKRAIPALVSISMTQDQASIVIHLVNGFVAPNAKFNQDATTSASDQAREAVIPVTQSFAQGETIITRGEVVTALHIEALEAYGLLKPQNQWLEIALFSLLVITLGITLILYVYRTNQKAILEPRFAFATSILFIITSLGLQVMIPNHIVLPYLFPAATLPMLLAVLIEPSMGILAAFIEGAIAGYLASRGLELCLYVMISGIIGALVIGKAERLSSFFWAGLAATISSAAIVIVFRFPDPATDLAGKATLLGTAIVSGLIAASLSLGLLILIGNTMRITTNLQLIELSRPDHPLLQLLLHNAPGSYQHSLQVANLAEQAARTIGANALLTRVGALYHDVGKTLHPQYFIENQVPGQNIHEQLDPATSASVIIRHVSDGLELAHKYRLPEQVQGFIAEHHGTMEATYQYRKALEAVHGDRNRVDIRAFSYPGPRPRSRETAILMLADSSEAKMRADKPQNEKAIDELVRSVIDDRQSKGQLSQTDLTLKDLDAIRQSFVNTFKSIYHPRIHYPEATAAKTEPAPPKQDQAELETDSK